MFFNSRLPRRNQKSSDRCTSRARLRLEALEQLALPSSTGGPGTLDPTFGAGGVVNMSLSASLPNEHLWAIAMEPNGEVLAAGGANSGGTNGAFALALFQTDGTLDPNFGTQGVVITSFNATNDTVARAIALEPNGQIVLAGYVTSGTTEFALARYNANGTLDSNFGTNGLVTTPVDDTSFATSVAIDASGNIVVAGGAGKASSSQSSFALARYTSDGVLDPSFGTQGIVETNLGPSDAGAQGLALQPTDGKIVVVGHTSTSGGNFHFAVLRYNTDGTLDTSFNGTGEVLDNFPGEYAGFQGDDARAVAIQADGKIVATGGFAGQGLQGNVALARYNSDGSPDTSFNGTGKTSLIVGNGDAGDGLTLQGNGKIIVTGSKGVPGGSPMLTIRYNADGSLDTGFGTNGVVTTKLSSDGNDEAHGALQVVPNGTIVVAGSADSGSDSNFALIRYLGDPPIDPTGMGGGAAAPQVPFAGTFASFTAADANLTAGQFTATVDWGDHSTASTGTIMAHPHDSRADVDVRGFPIGDRGQRCERNGRQSECHLHGVWPANHLYGDSASGGRNFRGADRHRHLQGRCCGHGQRDAVRWTGDIQHGLPVAGRTRHYGCL
jgi:uncharacterized delta-60 repeat protein